MIRWSVRQQLTVALWTINFLFLGVVGSLAWVWFTSEQSARLDEFLTHEISSVREAMQSALAVNPPSGDSPTPLFGDDFQSFLTTYYAERGNRPLPYKTTLAVFTLDGALVRATNTALDLGTIPVSLPRDLDFQTGDGPNPFRLAVVPLQWGGGTLGTIRMACLTTTLDVARQSFLITLVGILGLVFFGFGFLGIGLVHWSFRPVRTMSRSARRITETRLDLRITEPPGHDELAELAEVLNRMIAQLEQDFRFEETLVSQLSHELRTPLTVLRARNELTLEKQEVPPKVRAALEDNLADIDHVVGLLNTLLTLARIEGRRDLVKREVWNLTTLLEDLVEDLGPLWEEKTLNIRWDLPPTTAPALVQKDLVRQAVLNILTNAYRHTPAGGVVNICLEPVRNDPSFSWRLVIHNSGNPIPSEALESIFRRFFRAEPSSAVANPGPSGFGLGLSIAKTMIEIQSGRIRAFNPAEGGAAFEILFSSERSPQ